MTTESSTTGLWDALAGLWAALGGKPQLILLLIGVFACAVLLNVAGASLSRVAGGFSSPPTLVAQSASAEPAKLWTVTKLWQGSGNRDTEEFTVAQSWRVDWIFNPGPGGALQVFIYHADSKTLMNVAVNSHMGGSDTSFWAGAGKYYLRVSSTGGDWKIDVQDQK